MRVRQLVAVLLLAACGTPSSGPPASTPRDAAVPEDGSSSGGTSIKSPDASAEEQHVAPGGVEGGDSGSPTGPADASAPDQPGVGTEDAADADAGGTGTLTIATFNIQVFGPTKASKPDIVAQLVENIRRYDVIAIQEIKDATGAAPRLLLDAVNNGGTRTYAMLLSPRTGVQPDDRTSQEQYAVLYDTAIVEAMLGDRLFDDAASDLFQREPYVTPLRTRSGGFSFVLIGIHTRPESAVAEIGALHDVVYWAKTKFPAEDDFIVLGDFNAGCRYGSPAQLDALDLRGPSYFWIVPDDSDSNLATTACAYDRIVTTLGTKAEFTGNWGVDRAFTDKAVSDHWPVWAEFRKEEGPSL